MVDTHHYNLSKPVQCIAPRMNPNVSYGLWIMMCQCSFTDCNKGTTLVHDVDSGRICTCSKCQGRWYMGNTWEISVPFAQFCREPRTTLKNSLFKTKTKNQ